MRRTLKESVLMRPEGLLGDGAGTPLWAVRGHHSGTWGVLEVRVWVGHTGSSTNCNGGRDNRKVI